MAGLVGVLRNGGGLAVRIYDSPVPRPHRLKNTNIKQSKRRDLYLKVTTSWDKR